MLQLQQLQEILKTKRKNPAPEALIKIIQGLSEESTALHFTLNLKGITIELLAKILLNEFQLYSKSLGCFYEGFQTGRIMSESNHTKAKRNGQGNRQRGNTTTARKRKENQVETTRNLMDLNEILEKQLSTPDNTTIRSPLSDPFSKQKQLSEVPLIDRIEFPFQSQEYFVTPLKQKENIFAETDLDQYRQIINVEASTKQRTRPKKSEVTKTRKKNFVTQPISEEINTYISVEPNTQVTIRKQVEDFLEATKKKKVSQKQNLFYHAIFKLQNEAVTEILKDKTNIREFSRENAQYLQKNNVRHTNNILSQTSGHNPHIFSELSGQEAGQYQQMSFNRKNEQLQQKVDAQIKRKSCFKFVGFFSENNLSAGDKSMLFYQILCNTERYEMTQDRVEQFGEIRVTFNRI